MMNRILKSVLILIIKACHFVMPYRRYHQFSESTKWFRTMWIRSEFKHWGHRSRLSSFIHLDGLKYIWVGDDVAFSEGISLAAIEHYKRSVGSETVEMSFVPEIVIGNGTHVGAYAHITSINSIKIGENCRMGMHVTITDNSHGCTDSHSLKTPPQLRPIVSKGGVVIENNVWIGDKVTILPGVTIGEGCVIAANSVVTKSMPSYCVVGGNPARVLKEVKSMD